MARILVAGGTGALGSAVVARLQAHGQHVRVLSRKAAPADHNRQIEWAQGDVVSGDGLTEALQDVAAVVNCTGDARQAYETDVRGVQRLAAAAHKAGVQHFFHISIIGIEAIDFPYYRHKLEAEAAIKATGIAYSIQRVSQFHTLLDFLLSRAEISQGRCLIPVAQDVFFQVIDTRDVADYILPLLEKPGGHLPDVGGPEVLRMDTIARIYLAARGLHHLSPGDAQDRLFSPAAEAAFRQKRNTAADNAYGKITWADYVRERYAQAGR